VISLRERLRELYFGSGPAARRFLYGLLTTELLLLAYFIAATFRAADDPALRLIDPTIGLLLLGETAARIVIAPRPVRYLLHWGTLVDLLVVLSLLLPIVFPNLVFLRVLRAARLIRSYHVLGRLARELRWVRVHEEALRAVLNLLVFVMVVSAAVFATQQAQNQQIRDFLDALYFTVTTLTTTGFGDITLVGEHGRLLSILIMLAGISLFFQLARAIVAPTKVRHRCADCGLERHERDAVHCKACGRLLDIPDQGAD
jgi:voltage-gated potassium channel